jgi:sugar phosphate isomerase/epimerase
LPDQSPAARLAEIAPAVRDLAAACKELGLKAGIQNHSGAKYVGAPVWDIYTLIRDLDPASIGICFDIGHATLEGGLSWPIEAKLMEPFYTAVFVKDFLWAKAATGWKDQWCPLGEGMVNRQFFQRLKSSGYTGPICQHHEYELGDHQQMVAQMKKDLDVLKAWMI